MKLLLILAFCNLAIGGVHLLDAVLNHNQVSYLLAAFSVAVFLFAYRVWYKDTHPELPDWAKDSFNEEW